MSSYMRPSSNTVNCVAPIPEYVNGVFISGVGMTSCFGKTSSVGLLLVFFVKRYEFMHLFPFAFEAEQSE